MSTIATATAAVVPDGLHPKDVTMRRRDAAIPITQSVTDVPNPSVALYVLCSQLAVVEAAAREDAVVLAFRDDGQLWLRLGSRLIQAATLRDALALAAAPEEPHP